MLAKSSNAGMLGRPLAERICERFAIVLTSSAAWTEAGTPLKKVLSACEFALACARMVVPSEGLTVMSACNFATIVKTLSKLTAAVA